MKDDATIKELINFDLRQGDLFVRSESYLDAMKRFQDAERILSDAVDHSTVEFLEKKEPA